MASASTPIVAVVLVFQLTILQEALSCSSKCWTKHNDPQDQSDDVVEWNMSIDPNKPTTGIITIDGTYNINNINAWPFPTSEDYVNFIITNDPNDSDTFVEPLRLLIMVRKQYKPSRFNNVKLMGVRKLAGEQLAHSEGVQDVNGIRGSNEVFKENQVNIQVSDLSIIADRAYHLYLGKPGYCEMIPYNYNGNDTLWEQYSSTRLSATTVISNRYIAMFSDRVTPLDNYSKIIKFGNITVCEDSQPVLCDKERYVEHEADLGETYHLWCAASGAPYLGSRWTDIDGNPLEVYKYKEMISNNDADSFMNSTLKIRRFSTDHIGSYTCTIYNKNFKNMVEKVYTLKYSRNISLLKAPCNDTFVTEEKTLEFTWIVEGWPLNITSLDCVTESGSKILTHSHSFEKTYAPPRLQWTLRFDAKTGSNMTTCVLSNGTGVLNEMVITRMDTNCTIEPCKHCFPLPPSETYKTVTPGWVWPVVIVLSIVALFEVPFIIIVIMLYNHFCSHEIIWYTRKPKQNVGGSTYHRVVDDGPDDASATAAHGTADTRLTFHALSNVDNAVPDNGVADIDAAACTPCSADSFVAPPRARRTQNL